MQHDVGQVVSDDRIAPQFVLQPEGAVEHGIILLGGPELEPDPPQPMPRLEGRRGDVGGIVPEQSACESASAHAGHGRRVGLAGIVEGRSGKEKSDRTIYLSQQKADVMKLAFSIRKRSSMIPTILAPLNRTLRFF
jgi:hypothetical protein